MVEFCTIAYQGSKGSISSGYSYSNDSRTINMNANGGVLIHSDGITFSTSMGDSIALVHAPGAHGAKLNNGSSIIDSQLSTLDLMPLRGLLIHQRSRPYVTMSEMQPVVLILNYYQMLQLLVQ